MFTAQFKNFILATVPLIISSFEVVPVFTLTLFIMIDVFTGVIASFRAEGVRSITSRLLSFGLIFKLFMVLIPLVVALTGHALGVNLMLLAVWALNTLIISEALSIIGNINTIVTRKKTTEIDALSQINAKIKSVLLDYIKR